MGKWLVVGWLLVGGLMDLIKPFKNRGPVKPPFWKCGRRFSPPQHKGGGVHTMSTGPLLCCVSVCVRVISNQSTSNKSHVSDLSKLDTLLYKTHIKVLLLLRYQGLT